MAPWLIVAFTVWVVYWLNEWENRLVKSLLDWIPAILFAYLIPAGISALLRQDYSDAAIHAYSKQYFIPLAIVAVMSSLSVRQLKSIGWKPIAIFVSGSCWIALFPVLVVYLLFEGPLVSEILLREGYWRGLPPVVGGWIGGSTSQLVLKELVACPEHIFLTILVLDNILVNIWTILMFQGIKQSDGLNTKLKISNFEMPDELPPQQQAPISPLICLAILIGTVLLTNLFLESFVGKVILLSFIGLAYSNLIRGWNFSFVLKIGGILIILVMAILGLKLKFDLIQFDISLLVFLVVWLFSHFGITLGVAKMLNVNLAWVPIASMANVGGIATAPAVTAAYEPKWMPHAIILAILSMATGTFWGMLTIYLLERLLV